MSGLAIKIIACITMLIDHIGVVFMDELGLASPYLYYICRLIGRIAFPIFAFCAAEGAANSSNPKKYLFRMLSFALIAQLPYMLMCGVQLGGYGFTVLGVSAQLHLSLSVMFTLSFGLVCCVYFNHKRYFAVTVTLAVSAVIDTLIGMDYGLLGVLFVFALYLVREKRSKLFIVILVFAAAFHISDIYAAALLLIFGSVSGYSLLMLLYPAAMLCSALPILHYNGKAGRKTRLMYFFYPLHMLMLWVLWAFVP